MAQVSIAEQLRPSYTERPVFGFGEFHCANFTGFFRKFGKSIDELDTDNLLKNI